MRVGRGGEFEVLGTGGDSFLGGEDVDRLLLDWLVGSFRDETGIDLYQDRQALQRLKDAAETAKRELSVAERVEISLPFIAMEKSQPRNLQRVLTRADFDRMARPLVDRTLAHCREALAAARIDPSQIDDVLMVGGSSRIPLVLREVERFLGKRPCQGVNPDEAIAIGAALHGESLASPAAKVRLRDVTSQGLGFRLPDNRWQVMIERNTSVPAEATYHVTTSRPGQTMIRFMVLQGVAEAADDNELLGEFRISGFRPSNAVGEVDIEVTFALDDQGMVRIRARDVETGHEQTLEIAGAGGLSDAELQGLRTEALVEEVARLCDELELGVGEHPSGQSAIASAREAIRRCRDATPDAVAEAAEGLAWRRSMLRGLLAALRR